MRQDHMFMNQTIKERIFSSFSVTAFLGFTLFVFGPSYIYFTNALEFSYTYSEILKYCLFLFFAVVISFSLILATLSNRFFEKGVSLLFAISFLLWVQGNILIWDYGPLDGRFIKWEDLKYYGYIDTMIWLCGLFFALYRSKVVFKFASKLSFALILIQAITLLIAYQNTPTPSSKDYVLDSSRKFSFSEQVNVIILVLDSFQTDVFQEIIVENPKYAKDFDGFTYFRNTLGGFPRTYLSVPLILTGQFYDNSMPVQEFIKNAYLNNSLPKILKESNFKVDLFPLVRKGLYYSEQVASNMKKKLSGKISNVAPLFLFDLALFRQSPHFLKPYIHNNQSWLLSRFFPGEQSRRTVNRDADGCKPRSQGKFIPADAVFIEDMTCNAHVVDEEGMFKFYHLKGVHRPYILNENFEFERMGDGRNGFKRQAKVMLKLTDLFFRKLKRLGIYDNSLIVIIGDHGVWEETIGINVKVSGRGDNTRSSSLPEHIRASGLPLFLVKRVNAKGDLKISDAPVSLGDIPRTVVSELNISRKLPGKSIFDVGENEARERQFFYYEFDGSDVNYLRDMQEYNVSGFSWLDGSWNTGRNLRSGEAERLDEKYQLNDVIAFGLGGNARKWKKRGWSSIEKNFTWTVGQSAILRIPFEELPEGNLILSANVFPFLGAGKIEMQEVNVYINDIHVAVWPVTTAGEFRTSFPGKYLSEGYADVRFDISDCASPLDFMINLEDDRKLGIAFQKIVFTEEQIYKLGSEIDFSRGGNATDFIWEGWSSPEDHARWTCKRNAIIVLPLEAPPKKPLVLQAHLEPLLVPGQIEAQNVNIYIDDRKLGSWFVKKAGVFKVKIPKKLTHDSRMRIRFELPDAASPASFGKSKDTRDLGVAFRSIRIIPSAVHQQ